MLEMLLDIHELDGEVTEALHCFYLADKSELEESAKKLRSIADKANDLANRLEQTCGTSEPASAEPPVGTEPGICPNHPNMILLYHCPVDECDYSQK